jgi:hypothetical protein
MAKQQQEPEATVEDMRSIPRDEMLMTDSSGVVVEVRRIAFEAVWRDRGWTEVDDRSSDEATPGESEKENI